MARTALHQPPRFYNLTLHPQNDERERTYYNTAPSGSLLLWIDEMYEQPRTPEDRVIGYWRNAKASRLSFQKDIRASMLYRVFNRMPAHPGYGGKDLDTCEKAGTSQRPGCEPMNPVHHGDFNDDIACFWRPAFWGATQTSWSSQFDDLPPQAKEECRVRRREE